MVHPSNYWTDKKTIKEKVMKILIENDWDTLPRAEILNQQGYRGLSGAIFENYGGFKKFKISVRYFEDF